MALIGRDLVKVLCFNYRQLGPTFCSRKQEEDERLLQAEEEAAEEEDTDRGPPAPVSMGVVAFWFVFFAHCENDTRVSD